MIKKNSIYQDKKKIVLNHIKYYVNRGLYNKERYMWLYIVLYYKNVSGCLSGGTISDFQVLLQNGENYIYEMKPLNNKIILYTKIQYYYLNELENIKVSYLCSDENNTISDEIGNVIPPIDNITISNRKLSPYINMIEYSNPYEFTQDIKLLPFPENIVYKEHMYDTNICNVSDLYTREETYSKIIFYKFSLYCQCDMPLNVYLGFSGPIKVWINGVDEYHCSKKSLPINMSDTIIQSKGHKGINDIVIALKVCYFKTYPELDYLRGIMVKIGIILKEPSVVAINKINNKDIIPLLIKK